MKIEIIPYKIIFLGIAISLYSAVGVAQSNGTVLDNRAQMDLLLDKNEALRQQLLEALSERPDPGSSTASVKALEDEIDRLSSELETANTTIEQLREAQIRLEAREEAASDRESSLLEQLDKEGNERKDLADQLLAAREQYERERIQLTERVLQAEEKYQRCVSGKEQACAALANQCEGTIDTQVTGILATIKVSNECRKNEQLIVRVRANALLPARMVTRFNEAGSAELVFPVIDDNTQLRVMGATAETNQDLSLSPQKSFFDDFVVLRWEDELVDLNLVMSHGTSGESVSANNPQESIGEITLAQDSVSQQNPRFELFTSARGAPVLDLLVSHASLSEQAVAPFCGEAEAATPTFLLMIKDRNGFRQLRDEISPIPCGQQVLPDSGYFLANYFNPG